MVSGMRQVGKSTLLEKLSSANRRMLTFDDLRNLEAIKTRVQQFSKLNPPPCFLDEVQHVPEIFPELKIIADQSSDQGLFWLSGSQKLTLMPQLSDSLPGRRMNFELWPFSIYELSGKGLEQKAYLPPFSLPNVLSPLSIKDSCDMIFHGMWPALTKASAAERNQFFRSLLDFCILREVVSLSGVNEPEKFEKFLIVLARRTGQELRLQELAKEIGVAQPTIKRWLSIAEASGIVYFLRPYSNNIGKQIVKSPKRYFSDTGLVCYLLDIQNGEELTHSQLSENIFENFVVNEIKKSWAHSGKAANFHLYRNNEGLEIDLRKLCGIVIFRLTPCDTVQ